MQEIGVSYDLNFGLDEWNGIIDIGVGGEVCTDDLFFPWNLPTGHDQSPFIPSPVTLNLPLVQGSDNLTAVPENANFLVESLQGANGATLFTYSGQEAIVGSTSLSLCNGHGLGADHLGQGEPCQNFITACDTGSKRVQSRPNSIWSPRIVDSLVECWRQQQGDGQERGAIMSFNGDRGLGEI